MNKLLKDPLIYFLLFGFGLFVLFELVGNDEDSYDSRVIVVDRDSLLTFLQYRSRAFEPTVAEARLDSMPEDEFDRLVADFVREEALHREAKALGMDQNDYIIKRRMIQSVEFITDDFVTAAVNVTDQDLSTYYDANREDYYVNPYVTFAHVFFDGAQHSRDEAVALANAKLQELNDSAVPFNDAPRHGERFPFFVNYVERDPQFVADHFGAPMADEIFALDPSESTWRGPFESKYGVHLLLLTRKAAGRFPELEEVEIAVRADAEREAIARQKDKTIQEIVDAYEVRLGYEPD